jgi:hypothetical protein
MYSTLFHIGIFLNITHCLIDAKDTKNKADLKGRLCREKIGLLYPPPGTETTRTRRRSIDGADIFHLGEGLFPLRESCKNFTTHGNIADSPLSLMRVVDFRLRISPRIQSQFQTDFIRRVRDLSHMPNQFIRKI